MIKFLTTIVILFCFTTLSSQESGGLGLMQTRDSLEHELRSVKDDTTRVLIMVDLSVAYNGISDSPMVKYGNQALALAKRIRFSRGEARALNALGNAFQIEGDYAKSLEYLYRSLRITEEKNYTFEAAVCYSWIGQVYWFLEDYSKEVDVIKKSQNLFKTIINNPGVGKWVLYNILDIGQGYLEYQLDSAYHYLSQYYDATLHDKFWHPVALYSFGDCLFRQGNRETSFNYVREGIAGAGDHFTQAEACAVMSRFFKTIHHLDSAIYYARKGLTAADSTAYALGIYKNSKLLAEEYEIFNTEEALYYRKIYDSVNESMYGAKKVQDLQKTLAEEQRRQQQIEEEQISKETRLKQYGFIAGLVIMLLIAFIFYRNNLQKKKANVLLQQQKRKVEITLQELESTQAQLIQSEKMASLGELTAGIAHEIQNPLNFMNNFSEINAELIDEAGQQMAKGNIDEAKSILDDIRDNEQKISHHGKRADAIVKGMLQHSRTSSGQKEPTDINKLADEYLRLAYQGFRARDKSFNATIITDFDENVGSINIIPQEMGRVILNLINNAFYAVGERSKQNVAGYEPTVSVRTQRLQDKIEISVKDNGNGIPASIKEKIFQPFFTTKPTGQGTGLGLSLAYEIIKAHGGEVKVETKENEGATFTFQIPIKPST